MTEGRNILLMMSGSIACAKATALISEWARQGHAVRVACTASAAHFVGRATLEGLSGHPVFDDTFEAGRAMDHIALAQWADLMVVCPCSSNLINKFAGGIADDAVSTLWQAAWGREIPQFIAPAMNTHMWHYPATRASVEKLSKWGVHVLPTAEGDLACGERGEGRMMEPADIIATIDALLTFEKPSTHRVLITGGGTREPIDAVRYIGNRSSGRTSARLADTLSDLGMEVTWLGARSAVHPENAARILKFEQFADLRDALFGALRSTPYDMVIHAAAVSDFSCREGSGNGKLASGGDLVLHLAPNPKLLGRIRAESCNPEVRVVGFKLTAGADQQEAEAAVKRLYDRGGVDLVVHNDMEEIREGRHVFHLYGYRDAPVLEAHCRDSGDLARRLVEILRTPEKEFTR